MSLSPPQQAMGSPPPAEAPVGAYASSAFSRNGCHSKTTSFLAAPALDETSTTHPAETDSVRDGDAATPTANERDGFRDDGDAATPTVKDSAVDEREALLATLEAQVKQAEADAADAEMQYFLSKRNAALAAAAVARKRFELVQKGILGDVFSVGDPRATKDAAFGPFAPLAPGDGDAPPPPNFAVPENDSTESMQQAELEAVRAFLELAGGVGASSSSPPSAPSAPLGRRSAATPAEVPSDPRVLAGGETQRISLSPVAGELEETTTKAVTPDISPALSWRRPKVPSPPRGDGRPAVASSAPTNPHVPSLPLAPRWQDGRPAASAPTASRARNPPPARSAPATLPQRRQEQRPPVAPPAPATPRAPPYSVDTNVHKRKRPETTTTAEEPVGNNDAAKTAVSLKRKYGPYYKNLKKTDMTDDMPRKNFSAYNIFFAVEREKMIQVVPEDGFNDNVREPEERVKSIIERLEALLPEEEAALEKSLADKILKEQSQIVGRNKKARRKHRKSHGKVAFTDMNSVVCRRWRTLPAAKKNWYRDLGIKDLMRFREAMHLYEKEKFSNSEASK